MPQTDLVKGEILQVNSYFAGFITTWLIKRYFKSSYNCEFQNKERSYLWTNKSQDVENKKELRMRKKGNVVLSTSTVITIASIQESSTRTIAHSYIMKLK